MRRTGLTKAHSSVNRVKMPHMSAEKQERMTVVVGAKVTPTEKEAIETVAGVRGVSISSLLRSMSVADILNERKRLEREHGLVAA